VGKKLVLLVGVFIIISLPNLTVARHLPYGDLNADYKVDFADLNLFAQQWLNPSGCSGSNCADFEGINGVSFRDFALLADSWLSSAKPVTLVINELMADNSGYILDEYENSDDWIELYNYGDAPVDIADMYMSDSPANPTKWRVPDDNPSATIIPPHSYLLIWADDEQDEGTLHAAFKLSANDGEQIYLYDAAGNLIDSVVFGPQNTNESYGRLPDGSGNWQTFIVSTSPPPTPGKANAGAPSANQIVINEIMYNTSSFNEFEEYIEIYNQGSTTVSLGNWRFIDGVSFTFPPDLTLPAGQYLVIAADLAAFQAKYPSVTNVIGSWFGQLSRKGERITLVDEIGVVIDEVKYADEGDWAQRFLGPLDYGHRGWKWSDETDGGGKSLELINPGMPNEYGQNWTASAVDQGTPGQANTAAQSNIAPLITNAKHHPFIPSSSDLVTVEASVIDELSTGITVTLHYRVDGATSFTQVAMADDGLNGDEITGDGIYAAQIPAYSHKTIIEFYIEAEDSSNNTRTLPAPSDVDGTPTQVTNMLYVVDDTFNPVWTAGNQPVYYIIMTAAERAELEDISDDGNPFTGEGMSNAQMNATFISLDGTDMKIRYNTGVRNRGNRSRVDPPMNYHVNFRNDDLWKNVAAININSKYAFVQVVGSAFYRLAGLPAPVTSLVEVRVNGDNIALTDESHMWGSYAALECYDTYWADNHFPDDPDGNLYRCSYFENIVDPIVYANLIYRGTNPDDYVLNYIKQTNEEEADYNDIFNLTYVLSPEYISGIADANFFEDVNEVMHIEKWMRYLAVDTLIGNAEGGLITGDGDDYAMYRGVNDTRFWLMPHDLDTILGQGDYSASTSRSIFSFEDMDGLYRLLNDPRVVQIYYNQLIDLINTIFAEQSFNDTLDNILANSYVPQANIDAMKQYAANRAASVLSQIPQEFSASVSLPVSSGYYRTDANIAVVSGTANVLETKSVLVNGLKAAWDSITGQWFFGEGGGDIISQVTLAEEDAAKAVLIPSGPVSDTWRSDPDFDDSAWNNYTFVSGKTGSVGYENDNGYKDFISYDVGSAMFGHNNSCLIRIPFTVTAEDLANFNFMTLQMRYDDGFVAFINGQKVASIYEPSPLEWDSSTASGGSHEAGINFNDFEVSGYLDALQEGENILAIHGLNTSTSSSDFLISARLIAGTTGETYEGVVLNPGINRVIIQTFDEPDGAGSKLHEDHVDIWYDTGYTNDYNHFTLTEDSVWTAGEGPYHIIGDLVVPGGIKLTIEPGTSIYFDADSSIIVNGIIDANGTEYQRIRMTSVPGEPYVEDIRPELPYGPPKWDGIQLQNTMSPFNRIAYTDIEYAQTSDGAIGLVNSEAIIDNVSFAGSHLRMISTDSSSAIIRNCSFADMYTPDQWPHLMTPPLDNVTEHINAVGGIPPGGYYIIENNIFGTNKGHNDIVDFTGHSNQLPVVQVLNNVFTGGGDEALDLGGDAYIEGNLFMNFHKDISNTSAGNSNAMSTGDDISGEDDAVITVVRNKFYNLDYVVTFKHNTFMNFENNTIVDIPDDASGVEYSAINFYCVEKPEPQGKGAFLNSNIFWDIPQRIFGQVDVSDPYNPSFSTDLEMHHTLVSPERANDIIGARPGTIMDLGVSNIAGDPLFKDPNDDLSLLSMSPAKHAGDNGIDMGADVPAGASISGEPVGGITYQTSVTLNVAGPAITGYVYKVNNGSWSAEQTVTVPISLTGLSNGQSYTVYVLGKNVAGVWQTEPVASETFSVDTSYYRFVINEVLAHSHGTAPDIVELYYDGPATLDITGYSITDNPDYPQKFVFPATTVINPGQYKIYYADSNEALPDILGFSLDSYGEGLYLYDVYGNLVDSIEFGSQLNDITIGRLDDDQWHPTIPTFGAENIPHLMAGPYRLKINEWIANTDVRFEDDIIEIYNPSDLPVDLGGLYITDDPFARPYRHKIKQLTFVPANGFAFFYADGDELSRSNHLNFRISADAGLIALFDESLVKIDEVIYYSQTADYSQGRYPDGAADFHFFELPTPERSNVQDPLFINNNIDILNNLRVTELMYNPPDVDDIDEYIELHNIGPTTLDISGVKFTDGITYIFPNNTFIPASGYIVLAADTIAFKAQYPLVPDNLIYGPYDGALDNGGEKVVLTLADPMLAAVLRFEYDDAWYPDTDGLGESLSIIDPTVSPKDWNKAQSWQAAVPTPAAPNPGQSEWTILTYDDFEAGWGSYISGGEDALLYTSGTYAHQDSNAVNIQHSGETTAAFFYQTAVDIDTPGYTELKIDFWFYALDMEPGESFKVVFFDGSAYNTVATYISGTDFSNNNFYHETICLEEGTGPGQYSFPANMDIKFECVASSNNDDVYIDQIEVSAK